MSIESERKLLIVAVDLAGYFKAAQNRANVEVAGFLDDFYHACAEALEPAGGRIVKFMGDACLAVFPPERAMDAIDAVAALRERAIAIGARHRMRVGMGANLHIATVAEGEIGPPTARRYDVIGEGVNHTFRMGGAGSINASEPVYRRLPPERRSPWLKRKPPATYTLRE